MADKTNTLHIYGQSIWHSQAWIVGDREALTKLRHAVDRALAGEVGAITTTFTNDGEGYGVLVIPATEDQMAKMVLPYTETFGKPWEGTAPHELLSPGVLREKLRGADD